MPKNLIKKIKSKDGIRYERSKRVELLAARVNPAHRDTYHKTVY